MALRSDVGVTISMQQDGAALVNFVQCRGKVGPNAHNCAVGTAFAFAVGTTEFA